MKAKTILIGFMFLALLSAVAVPARAQAAKPAVSSHPQAADTAAHKQLAIYLADFKSNPQDATLRQEIIELAKTLKPAPVVPLPARTDFARATAQLKTASTANDFNAAAKLFEQVATQAPWDADVYFNAASAYAQAADYDSAKRNLALYRSAVRPGVNTRKAEDLRSEIEQQLAAQQQQQAAQEFQQALQQFRANPNDSARGQIIKIAQAMKTPPAIPEEAREHYVMATAFAERAKADTESAKDDSGLKQAATESGQAIVEYKAALLAAPWWADAYKKLAIAQKGASQYDDAIASLSLYLTSSPADARDAQDEIYKLKADKQAAAQARVLAAQKAIEDQQAQQRAAEERKAREREEFLESLNGARYVHPWSREVDHADGYSALEVRGDTITFKQYERRSDDPSDRVGVEYANGMTFKIVGRNVQGAYNGFISQDGSTITLYMGDETNVYRRER